VFIVGKKETMSGVKGVLQGKIFRRSQKKKIGPSAKGNVYSGAGREVRKKRGKVGRRSGGKAQGGGGTTIKGKKRLLPGEPF